MSNDNPTVEVDGTELEIRETDDGFEAVEVEESEKPDDVSDYIWSEAMMFSDGTPTVHRTNTALTFVEDDDGDLWTDVGGEHLSDVAGHLDVVRVVDTHTPETIPTVMYNGEEIGIKETADGYEAVDPDHGEKPDALSDYVWNNAQRHSAGTPTIYETNTSITFVEDDDGDLWVDVGGKRLAYHLGGGSMLHHRHVPESLL